MKNIFVNPEQRRLRAGWRLILQTTLLLVIAILLAFAGGLLAKFLPGLHLGLLSGLFAEFFVISASVFLARRLFDRRSIASLGLQVDRRMLADLSAGVGITLLMIGLIFLLEWASGWLRIDAFAWQEDPWAVIIGQTLEVFLVFMLIGWSEELLFRGYHLQTLTSGLNLFWGVLLSSGIFGLLHLSNPNGTWFGVFGVFLAGLFMTAAYLRTRRLWLSIGIHIGWNFFLGAVFGFPVSGLDTYRLLRITVQGPALWTGGAFGPEAGLVIIPGLLLGFGLVFFYTRGRLQKEDSPEIPIGIASP